MGGRSDDRRAHVVFRCFFFSSRRRHTRFDCDWSSDVCSSDLNRIAKAVRAGSRFDFATTLLILVGYAIPGFVLGVALLVIFGGQLQWFPLRGLTSSNWDELSLGARRSEEHTSELQSQSNLVCRLLLEKKNVNNMS